MTTSAIHVVKTSLGVVSVKSLISALSVPLTTTYKELSVNSAAKLFKTVLLVLTMAKHAQCAKQAISLIL